MTIDVDALSHASWACRSSALQAHRKQGLDELRQAIVDAVETRAGRARQRLFPPTFYRRMRAARRRRLRR